MIYLDGSVYPFDIEAGLSRTLATARENAASQPADRLLSAFCSGAASFYKTGEAVVTAGASRPELLDRMMGGDARFVVSRYDAAAELVDAARLAVVENLSDMRADKEGLANAGCGAALLSNPCMPTSLALTREEILRLAAGQRVVVDETYALTPEQSVLPLLGENENITVIKRLPFAGNICFATGVGLTPSAGTALPEELVVAAAVFAHPAAITGAEKKLRDGAESLYIRIKKLAVKFESVERLYRSRAGFVFIKVKDAGERAEALRHEGVAVGRWEGHLCVFAGKQEENNAAIEALAKVLA